MTIGIGMGLGRFSLDKGPDYLSGSSSASRARLIRFGKRIG